MKAVEKDFEELLRLFNKHKVTYCIVGAHAVAFYAVPRYTKDLDILVNPDYQNAERILRALRDFGFASLNLTHEDFCKIGRVIQLGYEPIRIDIINSMTNGDLDQIWKHKIKGAYGKEKVFFIGLQELIKNKSATQRHQDLADVEVLSASQKNLGHRKARKRSEN